MSTNEPKADNIDGTKDTPKISVIELVRRISRRVYMNSDDQIADWINAYADHKYKSELERLRAELLAVRKAWNETGEQWRIAKAKVDSLREQAKELKQEIELTNQAIDSVLSETAKTFIHDHKSKAKAVLEKYKQPEP